MILSIKIIKAVARCCGPGSIMKLNRAQLMRGLTFLVFFNPYWAQTNTVAHPDEVSM